MKKRSWKKLLALGLALAMTVTAAGCGKKGENSNGEGGAGLPGGVTAEERASLAKECVFSYKDVSIDGMEDLNVFASTTIDGKIYLLSSVYEYDEEKDFYGQNLKIITMNADGTGASVQKLAAPTNENEPDSGITKPENNNFGYGGIDDGFEVMPKTADNDVNVERTEDTLVDDGDDNYNNSYYYENNYYNNALFTDGKVFALRNHSIDSSDESGYHNVSFSHVDCWDLSGNLLWDSYVDLAKYQTDEEYSYVVSMVKTGDGVALMMAGNKAGRILVSEDGTSSELLASKADLSILERYNSMVAKEDGTLLISYYDNNYEHTYIASYNPETDTLSGEKELPNDARYMYNFSTSSVKDIIYSNEQGVYGFNMGDTEVTKIMDFVNSDLPTYGLDRIVMIDDKHFFASYYDSVSYETKFSYFSYVAPEDIKDKVVLVYGGNYIDSDAKRMIIDFNKSDSEYRIVIKDYSQYNTDDDYMAGSTQLNNDILANKMPDILQLDYYNMPVDSYISKGLFANVDELIQNDAELSKIEFVDNVFNSYRVNGVLYQVIPRYMVNTFAGKTSIVGDRTSWTMKELLEAAKKMPADASIFGQYSRESFIYAILNYGGSDFVDVSTGKCNFDSDLFVSLLEFAKTLPKEDDLYNNPDFDWDEYYSNYESQYRENRTMLKSMYIADFSNMKHEINGYFGEPVSFVGFPTESGMGAYLDATISFAISAKNGTAEGAWKFLRTYLTEKYQKGDEENRYSYTYGLSVHKNVLKEQVKRCMEKSYWIDENGNKNEYDDYFYMNGQEFILDPLTQQQADQIYNLVTTVTKHSYYNEDITKIITEEADSFFNGPKSAKEVAGLIQNRVQLFVNENR